MIYRFEECSLDTERHELRRHGAIVAIAPQVFDLLSYLLGNRERIVTRDELFNAIWGSRIVSESVLATRIHAVRVAIGDTGADQRLIRTWRGRGVRFVGEVC